MKISRTSITNLQKKIEVLSGIPSVNDEWGPKFASLWNITIPLAVATQLEWITELSDKGCEEIERCFVALCETFDKTEEEMLEIALGDDLLDESENMSEGDEVVIEVPMEERQALAREIFAKMEAEKNDSK